MTRDVAERLSMFAQTSVTVDRIALTWDQIQQYDPPPNPAKTTDSRYADYAEQYGEESWELDAIDPTALITLIRKSIRKYRDDKAWKLEVAREQAHKDTLRKLAARARHGLPSELQDAVATVRHYATEAYEHREADAGEAHAMRAVCDELMPEDKQDD